MSFCDSNDPVCLHSCRIESIAGKRKSPSFLADGVFTAPSARCHRDLRGPRPYGHLSARGGEFAVALAAEDRRLVGFACSPCRGRSGAFLFGGEIPAAKRTPAPPRATYCRCCTPADPPQVHRYAPAPLLSFLVFPTPSISVRPSVISLSHHPAPFLGVCVAYIAQHPANETAARLPPHNADARLFERSHAMHGDPSPSPQRLSLFFRFPRSLVPSLSIVISRSNRKHPGAWHIALLPIRR